MRTYLLVALAALLLVVLLRAWARRRMAWVSVALIVAVMLPTAWFELRWRHTEQVGSGAVRAVSGRVDGRLVCQRMLGTWTFAGAESGHVQFDRAGHPSASAWLTYETCRDLGGWIRSGKAHPTLNQVIAVHVLTHEAVHVSGQLDEATTECLAMQSDARSAIAMGATPQQAQALQADYWTAVYPRMPDDYRSAACAPGGALDRRPAGSTAWP